MDKNFIEGIIRKRIYLEAASEYDKLYCEGLYGYGSFLGTLTGSLILSIGNQETLATGAALFSLVPLLVGVKSTVKKYLLRKELETKVEEEYNKVLSGAPTVQTQGYSFSDVTSLGNGFISRLEELASYIEDFKYEGYETDIASLHNIAISYEEDIIKGGYTKYCGFYEEALKEVERSAINGAAGIALNSEVPTNMGR